jgi:hypothetical protein
MSREMEDRLRAAYSARVGVITEPTLRPADPVDDTISPFDRVTELPRRRHRVVPLLAAAAVAGLAIATSVVVEATRHPGPSAPISTLSTGESVSASTPPVPVRPAPSPGRTAVSGPPQPVTSSPGAAYAFGYQPLWPFANLGAAQAWQAVHRRSGQQPWHLEAAQTALSFTQGYLGFTTMTVVTSTRVADGGTYVGVGYRDGNGAAHTAAVLFLVRFGPDTDSPWEVVGSADTTFSLEQPAYGTAVSTPMTVGGHITGSDENIRVTVRSLTSSGPVGGFCCQPAGGNRTVWQATVPFTAGTGQVLTIVATTGGHLATVERFTLQGVHT